MTDNPIRRATRESAELTARLWRIKLDETSERLAATPGMSYHLDRALTDAVQENNMDMDEYVAIKNAEEAERQIAEACIDAGMVGQEVELIAAIRAGERALWPDRAEILHALFEAEGYYNLDGSPKAWLDLDAADQAWHGRQADAVIVLLAAHAKRQEG